MKLSSVISRSYEYFSDPSRPKIPKGTNGRLPRSVLHEILRLYFLDKQYDLDQVTALCNAGGEDFLHKSFVATIIGPGDHHLNAQDIQGEERSEAELRVQTRMKLFDTIWKMRENGMGKKAIQQTIKSDLDVDEKWIVEAVVEYSRGVIWIIV